MDFCDIVSLPQEIGRLQQLEVLQMDGNPLEYPADILYAKDPLLLVRASPSPWCLGVTLYSTAVALSPNAQEGPAFDPPAVPTGLLHAVLLTPNPRDGDSFPTQVGFHDTDVLRLDLSECGLYELPPDISRLSNLTSLDLRFNELESLPVELGLLTGLQELELDVSHGAKPHHCLTSMPV